jgi:hypothetical protein
MMHTSPSYHLHIGLINFRIEKLNETPAIETGPHIHSRGETNRQEGGTSHDNTKLAVKLMGAFAAVVLVVVVTVVANHATAQEFDHFMFQGRMVAAQDMQTMLADYYARTGSWAGVQRPLEYR